VTQIPVTTYKGWTIEVSDYDGRFTATDTKPQNGEDSKRVSLQSETLEKLKKSIDARENKKKKAATVDLSLPVVNHNGTGAITGISLHNDDYLGIPRDRSHWSGKVYVDTPWVRDQLARIRALRQEAEAIEKKLIIAEVESISSSWHRQTGKSVKHDGDYAEAIADLKARYTSALLAAEEIAEKETEEAHAARRSKPAP
jgi:hypothetical protein